jgi:hypothetical protein
MQMPEREKNELGQKREGQATEKEQSTVMLQWTPPTIVIVPSQKRDQRDRQNWVVVVRSPATKMQGM